MSHLPSGGRSHGRPAWARGRRRACVWTLALLAVLVLPVAANDRWIEIVDVGGVDDAVAQSDVTRMAFDGSHPGTFYVRWSWDKISFTGANTGDACMLFDTDGDGNVNNSLCVQIATTVTTTTIASGFPVLFACADSRNDRCANPASTALGATTCAVAQAATDPFTTGESYPNDMQATCSVPITALAGTPIFTTVCSYPSAGNGGNNNPVDCIIGPGTLVADVQVTKTDGVTSLQSGSSTTYTLSVANPGPNNANGTVIQDAAAAGLQKTAVTCAAAGGAVCPAGLTTAQLEAGVAIPALPLNGSLTIAITATVTAASGVVTNTATVTAPTGYLDPDTANNTAADTDTVTPAPLTADLQLTKTDGAGSSAPGGSITYTLVATNAGPSAVSSASVTDTFPTAIVGVTWTCSASSGSSCPASGTGNISAAVNLPAGGTATFTATGTISGSATGTLANTASVAAPAGVTDPTPSNNFATDTNTLAPVADLRVTKTDGSATALPGTTVTYTIVATNLGPSPVTGATLADAVPAALTGVTWTCSASAGASCPASGAGNLNAALTLPSGGTATFTLSGTLSPTATGTLSNTATIAVPAGATDPTPANNSATDTDAITPRADLAVTKSNGVGTVVAGSAVTYTIVASNAGPAAVTGAAVSDTFPAALTGAAWTCTASAGSSCPASGSGSIAAPVSLAVGGTATFTVSATVSPSASGSLANTVSIAPPAGVTDPGPGNDSATDTDTVATEADVSVTKTDGTATAIPGTSLSYTIVVANAGPSAIAGVTVTDTLPASILGATWTCTAAGGGTCPSSGSGSIAAPVTLPAGASATFTVTGTISPSATGLLINSVSAAMPAGVTDPIPGNNTATDTDALTPQADLAVTKTDGSATVVPGAPVTYTIVASNAGPSSATGATVADAFPTAVTAITWTCTASAGSTCPASGSGAINAAVTLAPGGTATFTATGTVAPAATGVVSNTASVTPPAGVTDPATGNNTAIDTSTVTPTADLAVTKTDGAATATPGNAITYTIVASNAGPSGVVNAVVTDALPAALDSPTWTCVGGGGGACLPSGSGSLNTAVTLPAGATATFTVTATVSATATGTLVNAASIAPPAGVVDPASGNNSATDTDTLTATANLSVTKTDGSASAAPGGVVSYTIVTGNAGPAAVTGATVTDTPPAALSAVTWTCVASAGAACPAGGSGAVNATVDLAVGATATFTLVGTIDPTAFGTLANTATITPPAGVVDLVPGDDSATDTSTLVVTADVSVTKSSTPNPYVPGDPLTYTIVVTNAGPSVVSNVAVSDPLPTAFSAFTWTCAASAGSTCPASGGPGGLSAVVDLLVGGTATFTVSGTVPPGTTGVVLNTVTATVPSGVTDPLPGNNQAGDINPIGPVADLALTKSSTPTPYAPGAGLTYTIVVSNLGPSAVVGARVRDALPAILGGATWTCAASGAAACGTASGSGDIDVLVDLPLGETATFVVGATVPASFSGVLVNAASVSAPSGVTDVVPGNNTSIDSNNASVQADLSVTKTSTPADYTAGNAFAYSLVVTNSGPSDVVNARLVDALPAPVAGFGWTCTASGGTCGTSAGTGDIDLLVSLPVGATATVTVSGTVPAATTGPLVNTASVSPPAGAVDPDPTDNSATTTSQPNASLDLAVTKVASPAPYVPGQTLTYTIVASNAGPSAGTGAVVTDPLPTALAGFTWTCTGGSGGVCMQASGVGDLASLVDLPVGGTATFVITGTVPPGTTGALANTVTIAPPSGAIDPTPGNNTATAATPGSPVADLAVTKSDGSATATPGQDVTYTIVVSNAGPSAAVGATVTDVVPAVLTGVTWTCVAAGGAQCPASGSGAIGAPVNLPVGGTTTFTVTGTLSPSANGSLVNTASVTVPVGTSDPTPGNNSATDTNSVTPTADLAVTKSDGLTTAVPGQTVTWSIAASNLGPSAVVGATLADVFPATVTGVSWTCVGTGGASCPASGSGSLSATVDLPVGATVTVTATGTVAPNAVGTLSNTATIGVPAGVSDPVAGNDSATDLDTLTPRADLAVTKTNGAVVVIPGQSLTYTIVVTNAGPSDVAGAALVDTLPPAVTAATWTCVASAGSSCASSGAGNIATAVDLLAGGSATFTLTGVVSATETGTLVNTASVTAPAGVTDPNAANNAATDLDVLTPQADLSALKTATPASYVAGTPLTYTLVLTNAGPSAVTGARVQDSIPAALSAFTWTCVGSSGGSCGSAGGIGSIDTLVDLAVGGVATFVVTGTVPAATTGALTNAVSISPPAGVVDPVSANDISMVVTTGVPVANADVAVVKSGPATVLAGGTVVYTLTVTNHGPAVATGVVLADPTPTHLTFVSNAGACTTAFPCALGAMTVGEVRVITATYTAGNAPDGTVVTNIATVTSTSPDANPADNQATVPTAIVQRTDVGVTKSVAPAQVLVGAAITYTVTTTNHGPNPASGIVVTDHLPTGVLYQSSSPSQGAYDQVTGVWTVGALAVGQSATLTIGATVQVPGPITNLAVRTSQNEPDANPANDSGTAVVNSPPYADVGVAKSVVPATPLVGAPVTYTLVVTNYGPAAAPAVVVDDPVPAGLALVSATPSAGTFVSGTGRWTVGPLAVNASATLTIVANTTTAGTIVNRAVISGTGILDPNPANDQDAATVVVGGPPATLPANLRLSKVALRPYVAIDDFAEFIVTVTNDGPGAATGVVVSDQLPANLVFVAAQTSQGLYTGATGQWLVGTIAASQSATLQITTRLTAAGSTVNRATITGSIEPDPDPSDNTDTATVLTPPPGAVDLEITQELPNTAPPNGLITIRLVTRNLGPNVALNPYITGMIPPGTIFVSSNPGAGGSCTVPGNPPPPDPVTGYPVTGVPVAPLRCTWPGLMPPGETRVVEFTVRVAPGIRTGQILWSCFFTGTESDEPYQPNNVIDGYLFVDDGVSPVGDLGIQALASFGGVTATTLAVPVSAPVAMRFSTTNHGPAAARGQYALILDTANAIEFVTANVGQGWVAPSGPASGVWDTGLIAPGQTVMLDLTVRVRTAATVKLFAQRVAGVPGDPNASNERATIVLDGYAADRGGRSVAVGDVDGSGAGEIVTGTGRGETPQVRVFSGSGVDSGLRYFAYERSFLGGLQVASCDVNGDGVAEIITAPGPGRAPTIRVLNVAAGVVSEAVAFDAFETAFQGGASIACADLDADGSAELVVGAGPGRAAEVKVFNVGVGTVVPRATFAAYEAGFLGGVRVAAGHYAGRPGWLGGFDIATTPGAGRPAELRVFTMGGTPVAQAVVSAATQGLQPTLGDANGDGALDLVVAPDDGRPELLRVYDIDRGALLGAAPAGLAGFPVGVRVALGRLQGGPGTSEIVLGNGPGGDPRVRVIWWPASGPVLRLEILPLEVP